MCSIVATTLISQLKEMPAFPILCHCSLTFREHVVYQSCRVPAAPTDFSRKCSCLGTLKIRIKVLPSPGESKGFTYSSIHSLAGRQPASHPTSAQPHAQLWKLWQKTPEHLPTVTQHPGSGAETLALNRQELRFNV